MHNQVGLFTYIKKKKKGWSDKDLPADSYVAVVVYSLSRVWLCVTPWTVAHQAAM